MDKNRVEAVEKALKILETFKQTTEPQGLNDIATKTGLYKSTILRLLGSLQNYAYIARLPSGKYQLGANLWRLGLQYSKSLKLEEQLRPLLADLVVETQETAAYYVRAGSQRICLYRVNSPRAARHHLDEGTALPVDIGASGRVLLAYSHTVGELYDEIRMKQYYISLGERDPDVASVAVPLLDPLGALHGSLSVSGLRSRFNAERQQNALKLLQETVKKLALQIHDN